LALFALGIILVFVEVKRVNKKVTIKQAIQQSCMWGFAELGLVTIDIRIKL
jgi:hypothetical protein